MKSVVFVAILAVATAMPQFLNDAEYAQPEVRVLDERFQQESDGSFEYRYELDNGVKAAVNGRVQPGDEPETGSISMEGANEHVGPDGNTYRLTWRADEGGFQPQGDHLPVPVQQIAEYEQLRQEYPKLFWAEQQEAIL